jgi:hypothetical protein
VLTKAEMPVPASGHEPGVVNSTVYAGGRKVAEVAIEEAGEWSKRAGHVVWIGLVLLSAAVAPARAEPVKNVVLVQVWTTQKEDDCRGGQSGA